MISGKTPKTSETRKLNERRKGGDFQIKIEDSANNKSTITSTISSPDICHHFLERNVKRLKNQKIEDSANNERSSHIFDQESGYLSSLPPEERPETIPILKPKKKHAGRKKSHEKRTGMFATPPLSGSSHSGLDLVKDQHSPVFVAQTSKGK
jgi:hypothetical protein